MFVKRSWVETTRFADQSLNFTSPSAASGAPQVSKTDLSTQCHWVLSYQEEPTSPFRAVGPPVQLETIHLSFQLTILRPSREESVPLWEERISAVNITIQQRRIGVKTAMRSLGLAALLNLPIKITFQKHLTWNNKANNRTKWRKRFFEAWGSLSPWTGSCEDLAPKTLYAISMYSEFTEQGMI